MKNEPKPSLHEYDRETLRQFMALSVRQKLAHLENLNQFFQKNMPAKSREIWQKLRAKGF